MKITRKERLQKAKRDAKSPLSQLHKGKLSSNFGSWTVSSYESGRRAAKRK